jgi:hypothetical protein
MLCIYIAKFIIKQNYGTIRYFTEKVVYRRCAITSRKSKNDRKYNGQRQHDEKTNNDPQRTTQKTKQHEPHYQSTETYVFCTGNPLIYHTANIRQIIVWYNNNNNRVLYLYSRHFPKNINQLVGK